MSSVLESGRDLPKIRVIPVKTEFEARQSCTVADEEDDNVIRANDEDDCQTPTSEGHKIPAILSCPPAPRKTRTTASCKRKLSELEFFEIANREEVESFFRSSSEAVVVGKRRCPCM